MIADIAVSEPVAPAFAGFRAFLQSDYRAEVFWVKHAQLLLNLTLAGSYVLLSDGLPWQQLVRVAVNVFAVGAFCSLLVRVVRVVQFRL